MKINKITIVSTVFACATSLGAINAHINPAKPSSPSKNGFAGVPLNISKQEENLPTLVAPAAAQDIFNSRSVLEQLERATGQSFDHAEPV